MTQQSNQSYMGKDTVSTVYAAQLQGIVIALQIAKEDRCSGTVRDKAIIYTDNQAAIRTAAKPKGKSGAYLLQEIVKQHQDLQAMGLQIDIRWK